MTDLLREGRPTGRFDFERALRWILVLAVAFRLSFMFWWNPEVVSDAADYLRIANDLISGLGFRDTNGDPTSFRPPLYPFMLAGIFSVVGESIATVRVVQTLLDAVTILVVFRLAKNTLGARLGAWLAPIAALLVAVNLGQVAASQRVLSETLFTLLFVLAIRGSSEWWRSLKDAPALNWAVTTGFLLGLATLTRGIVIAYPFVLVAAATLRWRKPPRGSLTLLLCFAVTLAPWTLRNYRVHGSFVPVTTQVGMALYASYSPPDGVFGFQPSDSVVVAVEPLSEVEASRILSRAAIDTAFADPGRTARLELAKAMYFWSPIDWELLPRYGALNPTYLWMTALALLGLLIAPVRRAYVRHWPLVLPILYLFGMALVFHGSPRYRLPIEPLLALAAAATLVGLGSRYGARRAVVVATLWGLACIALAVYGDQLRELVRPWMAGL